MLNFIYVKYSTIIKFFFLFMGLFWVFFYLYLRIIATTREGYQIIELKTNITNFGIFVFIFISFINFSLLILSIFRLLRIEFKKSNLFFLNKFENFINFIYWKPLETVYEKILENNVPGSGNFFLFIETRFLTVLRDKTLNKFYYKLAIFLIVFVFDILPKLILSFIFFVEVVFFGQIKYFFVFIPLFFLPIFLKIFLKLLKSCGNYNLLESFNCFEEIWGLGEPIYTEEGHFCSWRVYSYVLKKEYLGVLDPIEELKFMRSLRNFLRHEWTIQKCLQDSTIYVSFFTSLLYFVAGLLRIIIICF